MCAFLESVWEPPAEGFLSVAEQEVEENKKSKEKASKKKAPAAGPKAKRKRTEKEGEDNDEDGDNGGEETAEPDQAAVAAPVRGEFEPFMMETTRIGSWKAVETA